MADQQLKFYKVVSLPPSLSGSSVYFVKKDTNAELIIYLTNSDGTVAYKTREHSDVLTTVNNLIVTHPYLMSRNPNPIFTYGTGQSNKNVIRIDYSNGVYRTFEYNPNNSVKKMIHYGTYFTITKNYVYNVNGTINSVVEAIT
jgi:hypothetical protein